MLIPVIIASLVIIDVCNPFVSFAAEINSKTETVSVSMNQTGTVTGIRILNTLHPVDNSFRFISDLPLTKNGKVDYKSFEYLPAEPSDIEVMFEETAMSMDNVNIV